MLTRRFFLLSAVARQGRSILSRIGDELYLEPWKTGWRGWWDYNTEPVVLPRVQVQMPLGRVVYRVVPAARCRGRHMVGPLGHWYTCHSPASAPQEQSQAAGLGLGCDAVTPHRVLGEAVLPFPPALAEVTLGIGCGRRVILRSYQEEEAESTVKAMVTEMSIGEEDFQQLQAQEGVAITFCLKELRGLLSFAESANLALSVHFDAPGRPAIFAVKDSLLDGHFVLATLSESDLHSPELRRLAPPLQAHGTPPPDDFANDDIDSYMIAMETTADSEASRAVPSIPLSPGLRPPCSPDPYSEDNEAEPCTEPGTPPPKKFRSLFFGSILAPAHSPPGPSPVLAEDSEGEG
uniref:Cell cycle checkpoint control protein RAD9A n=1 Tax=Ursus americanus TaxID=9643 RepID=A0A452QMW3_URSAM